MAAWDKIEDLAQYFETQFNQTGTPIVENLKADYNWHNQLWTAPSYRRAHVEIVDNRTTHGIYILHTTVFAHFNDSSPIFGFDAVCGERKITGAFHDFSRAGDPDHFMMRWFSNKVKDLSWNRPRELPEWARAIFSPAMVAVGNLQDDGEIEKLCSLAQENLEYYLSNVGLTQDGVNDFHMAQNRYCQYQKQNPQVVRSMVAMGVEESVITRFVDEVLFPETRTPAWI